MRSSHTPDYLFISLIVLITLAGLACLLSASIIMGKNNFNDPFYYFKHQLLYGGAAGLAGFLLMSKIYYRRLEKLALPLLLVGILLMLLVFTPLGLEINGARRWVSFPFAFQPGEIIKLVFTIYLAAWISKRTEKIKTFKEGFFPFLLFLAMIAALFVMQRSTSTLIIVIGTALAIFFLSRAKLLHIGIIILLGLALLAGLVLFQPYQTSRLLSFMNSGDDPQGRDYQINQALIAIGSGGLTGVGFGNAVSKYNYLPEPMGDSIFAVIAQEFGFIGVLILISLYVLFLFRGLSISKYSPDTFSQLLSAGLTIMVVFQAFINIAAMSKLIPLTGQPLPFISYGGTSLGVLLTSMGIIVNISKYTKK
ncbi:MAG: putative peptidoglycan glycosyltransferase FtsW [bacterium]|nr:putative peptidoglycan glycosyltransferase FtsW [bacterium]